SDIADIRRGYEDPATYIIRHEGEPAIMLAAVMQSGWNGLELGKKFPIKPMEAAGYGASLAGSSSPSARP
ncbi:hypothetical protein B5K10_13440, partial [Rhizobium leguminosarum bv. trifolii]